MLYRSKYSLLRHSRAKCQCGLKHYSTVHISELTCLQVGEAKIDIFLGVDTLGVCIGIPMSSAWGFPWDFPWGNSCGNSTGREFLVFTTGNTPREFPWERKTQQLNDIMFLHISRVSLFGVLRQAFDSWVFSTLLYGMRQYCMETTPPRETQVSSS